MNEKYTKYLIEIIDELNSGSKVRANEKMAKLIDFAESKGDSEIIGELKKTYTKNMKISKSSIKTYIEWLDQYYYESEVIRRYCDSIVSGLESSEYQNNKFLLYGEPGTGKTEFVHKVSNYLNLKVVRVSYSSLINSKLGSTLRNIKALLEGDFDVIFFDEFDAIASDRNISNENEEMKRANIQIMNFLEEFPKEKILFSATNMLKKIDSATLRRFDRVLEFSFTNDDSKEMFKTLRLKYISELKNQSARTSEMSTLLKTIEKNISRKEHKPHEIKVLFQKIEYFNRVNKKYISDYIIDFLKLSKDEIKRDILENKYGFSKNILNRYFGDFIK